MIINSIKLKNFKSYEEETLLTLKPHTNKNIILIGGENGAGKSTLFQAIKLCFYGATAYGYVGQNHYYTELVKSYINNNAFLNEQIDTFVELDVTFNSADSNEHYILKRCWTYAKEKITETFYVYHNDQLLQNEELDYFDQYLKATIPPSLFNFFFFDGEELGSFFTSKTTKQSMKESVLELFNFNTFDVLQKQLKSYQRAQSKQDRELKKAQDEYDTLNAKLKDLSHSKDVLTLNIENDTVQYNNMQAEKDALEHTFRQQGGLLESEKNSLSAQISRLETERAETSVKIREFCNNELPFLLLPNHMRRLAEQIKKEQSYVEYTTFRSKLNPIVLADSLRKVKNLNLNPEEANKIIELILSDTFSINQMNETIELLGLSKEQSHSVLSFCNMILNTKSSQEITNLYAHVDRLTDELKEARVRMNSTVTKEQLNEFMQTIETINTQSSQLKHSIDQNIVRLQNVEEKIEATTRAFTKAKNETLNLLQNSNISKVSSELIAYFNELLKTVTAKKVSLIEEEFLNIFGQIIRKDNFIDDIKLDEDFNTTLYIYKNYNISDLLNICNNLGIKNLSDKYGTLFVSDLYRELDADADNIMDRLWRHANTKTEFQLHTKVNVDLLSSGEKQVYVLCLIWAILKVSGVDIPFIIDTPYARIDSTHRNALTTLYLPKISNQVIILSTNEEIDQELYQTIQPFIADEHLLIYDAALRKTTVKNTYFEV